MISLFTRLVIIVTIVIAATDSIIFYILKRHGTDLNSMTWHFVILVIIITIVPIVINFWYWLIFKQKIKYRN
jgi:hypothetical protein